LRPASDSVGISAAIAGRFALVVASARSLPGLDVLQDDRRVRDPHLRLPAQHVGHRRGRCLCTERA
jgi:hypothetical protein